MCVVSWMYVRKLTDPEEEMVFSISIFQLVGQTMATILSVVHRHDVDDIAVRSPVSRSLLF